MRLRDFLDRAATPPPLRRGAWSPYPVLVSAQTSFAIWTDVSEGEGKRPFSRTHSECESSFDTLVIVQVRNNQANEKHRVPDRICERIAAR